jgi:hypothetical protein
LKNIRILRVTVVFYWERNNYGLWDGAETDIPLEDRESTIRAHALYKLLIKR